jgi:CheY-like chemotaxis protein
MIVLVADDSQMIRSLLEGLLGKIYPDAITAIHCEADGSAALDRYRLLASEHPESDLLVLMDIDMPIMDGITAVGEIRSWEQKQDLQPARIMMVTANDDRENRERSYAAGAEAVIPKPLSPERLRNFLDEAFSTASSGSRDG